ncbi:Ankyrin repeat domain-containing protein 61, partial [Linnemannia schmuckeri]
PEATRKKTGPRTSHIIEVNKVGSSTENGAQCVVNHNPPSSNSGSNPPPRSSPGFSPAVDTIHQGNRSPGAAPKEQEDPAPSSRFGHEECTTDSRSDPREMCTAPKDENPPLSQGSASNPGNQFDNFYSLADPYKESSQDEQSDFLTAMTQGDLEMIEKLLKAHSYLLHKSIGSWPHPTPILFAARSRHAIDTLKVLIKHGAALDRGDHNGTTVLHLVCRQYPNPIEVVILLTNAGANCNSRDSKKRTPLMVLFQNSHITSTKVMIETMLVLFKLGAQITVVDQQYQRTPLHFAIHHCKEPAPVIELLLKKGAEVNAIDSPKSTPLHMVLEKMDNEEIVQMLLLYGADPSLRNGNKRNALCVAAENLRVMSARFLLENDLSSSALETIKKANELCSKADGPDKDSKPLFKNLLSNWRGKEGKIRRIQLAQGYILRLQQTPDMKTVDQTQIALEFLKSAGASIYLNEQDNSSNGGGSEYAPLSSGRSVCAVESSMTAFFPSERPRQSQLQNEQQHPTYPSEPSLPPQMQYERLYPSHTPSSVISGSRLEKIHSTEFESGVESEAWPCFDDGLMESVDLDEEPEILQFLVEQAREDQKYRGLLRRYVGVDVEGLSNKALRNAKRILELVDV